MSKCEKKNNSMYDPLAHTNTQIHYVCLFSHDPFVYVFHNSLHNTRRLSNVHVLLENIDMTVVQIYREIGFMCV